MTAGEKILSWGGDEDTVIFSDFSYDDALIGITIDNRAVYEYNKMVEYLMVHEGFSEEEAVEWIDYNTIRALPYGGEKCPIIMYLEEE